MHPLSGYVPRLILHCGRVDSVEPRAPPCKRVRPPGRSWRPSERPRRQPPPPASRRAPRAPSIRLAAGSQGVHHATGIGNRLWVWGGCWLAHPARAAGTTATAAAACTPWSLPLAGFEWLAKLRAL